MTKRNSDLLRNANTPNWKPREQARGGGLRHLLGSQGFGRNKNMDLTKQWYTKQANAETLAERLNALQQQGCEIFQIANVGFDDWFLIVYWKFVPNPHKLDGD